MRPCRRKELALAPGKKHGGGCSGLNHPVTSLCSPSLPECGARWGTNRGGIFPEFTQPGLLTPETQSSPQAGGRHGGARQKSTLGRWQ